MITPDFVRVPKPEKTSSRSKGRSKSRAFPLFDKRKSFDQNRSKHAKGTGPRIFFFDAYDTLPTPEKPGVSPDDLVNATSLCLRLNAVSAALNDLTKQANRLKRAEARHALSPRLSCQGVLRIHTPPGHREKGRSADEHAVDEVLRECQILARRWNASPDTS